MKIIILELFRQWCPIIYNQCAETRACDIYFLLLRLRKELFPFLKPLTQSLISKQSLFTATPKHVFSYNSWIKYRNIFHSGRRSLPYKEMISFYRIFSMVTEDIWKLKVCIRFLLNKRRNVNMNTYYEVNIFKIANYLHGVGHQLEFSKV